MHILLMLFSYSVSGQALRDTFSLYFDLDVPTLNQKMEKKIDLLIYNDKIVIGSKITIVGYADYLGSKEYNKDLSVRRAANVKDYLVKYGVDPKDITLCMGKGKIERDGVMGTGGYPVDRRVDLVVNNKGGKQAKIVRRKPTASKTKADSIDDISSLKPGSVFKLDKVYFVSDRHVIRSESLPALEKLYKVLADNPNLKIAIEGHVCCIPPGIADAVDIDTGEPQLSYNRAKAIYIYLIHKGIDASRLSYRGYGRQRPVVSPEMNEEDADKNRRVEVRVVAND